MSVKRVSGNRGFELLGSLVYILLAIEGNLKIVFIPDPEAVTYLKPLLTLLSQLLFSTHKYTLARTHMHVHTRSHTPLSLSEPKYLLSLHSHRNNFPVQGEETKTCR